MIMKTDLNRRQFLKGVTLTGAAFAAPTLIPGHVLGLDGEIPPSEKIVMGGIGIGGRGGQDLSVLMKEKVAKFIAIANIHKPRREKVKEMVDNFYGNNDCVMYWDMFELLDRKDIDAVLITLGDRWHTMASICAAKAGKDIYCEKPLSLTIQESRAVADAMTRYGRIFQAGTQRRNIRNFQIAANMAHSGKLGKLVEVHANTLHPATHHDWLPAEQEPALDEFNWNRWLGPCPWRPYNKNYIYGWHNNWDWHGGGILEWGTHTVDLCQWANQTDDTVPVEYWPVLDEKGDKGSANEALYANGVKLIMRDQGWLGLGTCNARFVGEEGWVETGDSGRMMVSNDKLRSDIKYIPMAGTDPDNHIHEFLEC
ncbi:MAG: Gfo/Idh/MocA family protein, partial [Thermoguttaceae bacterium]